MAERASGVRAAAIVVACGLAGLLLGLAVTALTDDVYRATALLELSAASDPRDPGAQAEPLPSQVLAASYAKLLSEESFLAGIAPQVAASRFDADELAERVDAAQAGDSAVVELTAEGGSRQEAQAVAADVVSAFVALVQQLSRQRTQQLEDELRRRLNALPADASSAERTALAAELAGVATRGVEQATSVRIAAAAYAPQDRVRPDLLRNLVGGLVLGLVAGLGATLLRRREPEPKPEPAVPEPARRPEREPVPGTGAAHRFPEPVSATVDETPPRVALTGPEPQSTVAGTVLLRIEASDDESGVAELELLVSGEGADWFPVARFEAGRAEAEWDTTTVADGVYWLSAVARDRAGHAAATPPLPLLVANTTGLSSPA